MDKADDFALLFYTCELLVYLMDIEIQVNFNIRQDFFSIDNFCLVCCRSPLGSG